MSTYWFVIASTGIGRSALQYQQRSSSLAHNWFVFAAIIGIVLFWVALYYWDKWRDKFFRFGNQPPELFVELCEAHRLSRRERALLLKTSERRNLKPATAVFVDSRALRSLASAGGDYSAAYRGLLKKLFGESA